MSSSPEPTPELTQRQVEWLERLDDLENDAEEPERAQGQWWPYGALLVAFLVLPGVCVQRS